MGGKEFDRDVDETFVEEADDETPVLLAICGVDSVAREQIAEQCVLAVRRAAISFASSYGRSLAADWRSYGTAPN
jgi:hypothetical protein